MLVGEPCIGKSRTAQQLASTSECKVARSYGAGDTKNRGHLLTGPGSNRYRLTFSN